MVCAHDAFESSVVVEKREGYPLVHVQVRCATCTTAVVFPGLSPAIESHFLQVAVARHGTEVILAGQMALAALDAPAPWQATTLVHPAVPETEPLQPPAQ